MLMMQMDFLESLTASGDGSWISMPKEMVSGASAAAGEKDKAPRYKVKEGVKVIPWIAEPLGRCGPQLENSLA